VTVTSTDDVVEFGTLVADKDKVMSAAVGGTTTSGVQPNVQVPALLPPDPPPPQATNKTDAAIAATHARQGMADFVSRTFMFIGLIFSERQIAR
jgi:hypothetical protein